MPTLERQTKVEKVVNSRQRDFVLIIEDVHDPHNAQAIFRTCDAFGIPKVVFIFDKTPEFDPLSFGKQSSASANKWIEYEVFHKTETCLSEFKKRGFTLYGTALSDRSIQYDLQDYTSKKVAILIGNEQRGLSKTALDMADELVMIPMRGMVQSLNVSVSTAIFIHEVSAQRGRSLQDYSLSEGEKAHLMNLLLER